ncbi:sucrose-specific PTS transporter subunit IIBC [Corynebacterium sp. SCR221107]|uniref:sucrose-specific PTS transporter subunit IIBC n=1 Tax=Corynebacterium sp. SCR221107 TaxID=3017361 RepID=UPI0022EC32B7|nr:sucrose-specific PTS transporter subunit IIBC [Corynebacterium sp. SCR221107]WBT09197.1 sucrose-specific PTS transporter subunit IIBC [Corynebacterium sp. SCR221107]
MQHKEVAGRVLQAIGGEDNIVAAAHCATRLRLVLKDSKNVDQAALDNDPDLKGTFETGGMYQIIVGPGDVNNVFKELDSMTSKNIAVTTEELKNVAAKSGSWFTRAIKALADIFVPLIPILVGGGLLMAINNVLTAKDLFGPESLVEMYPNITGVSEMINLLASAPFAFLPVLVGFTATKRFGGNEFLGAGIAMAMVYPSLVNGYNVAEAIANGEMTYWNLFGLDVAQAGYQGSVLPILLVSWILSVIEKFFHKHLKGTVDFLVTPVLTLLITGFLTFIAVGPVMRSLGDWLAIGLANLYDFGGPIGGFIFGLIYSPIVITGLHQSFPPIETMLWGQGGSFIFATASMANIAQGAVALAVFFLAKSEKLKGLAGASGMSAVFGITEPAIFGVNLRLRWPFYIGIVSAAIGSTLIAIFDVKAVALGAAGFIGFVSMRANDIGQFFICAFATFFIAFIAAYLYGRTLVAKNGTIDPDGENPAADAAASAAAAAASTAEASADALAVIAPLTGNATPLSAVSDPMFAQGKLGEGVAITPTEGKLVAPVSGKVVVAFPSGHAFAVRTQGADGKNVDVLMHIGFDTVNLKGQHFTPLARQGDEVKAGDVLCEFDIDGIKAAGYEVTTPVVVSNSKRTGPVLPALALPSTVAAGDKLMTVDPKPVAATTA